MTTRYYKASKILIFMDIQQGNENLFEFVEVLLRDLFFICIYFKSVTRFLTADPKSR